MVEGKTNADVARILNITPKGVRDHKWALLRRVHFPNMESLVAQVIAEGLLTESDQVAKASAGMFWAIWRYFPWDRLPFGLGRYRGFIAGAVEGIGSIWVLHKMGLLPQAPPGTEIIALFSDPILLSSVVLPAVLVILGTFVVAWIAHKFLKVYQPGSDEPLTGWRSALGAAAVFTAAAAAGIAVALVGGPVWLGAVTAAAVHGTLNQISAVVYATSLKSIHRVAARNLDELKKQQLQVVAEMKAGFLVGRQIGSMTLDEVLGELVRELKAKADVLHSSLLGDWRIQAEMIEGLQAYESAVHAARSLQDMDAALDAWTALNRNLEVRAQRIAPLAAFEIAPPQMDRVDAFIQQPIEVLAEKGYDRSTMELLRSVWQKEKPAPAEFFDTFLTLWLLEHADEDRDYFELELARWLTHAVNAARLKREGPDFLFQMRQGGYRKIVGTQVLDCSSEEYAAAAYVWPELILEGPGAIIEDLRQLDSSVISVSVVKHKSSLYPTSLTREIYGRHRVELIRSIKRVMDAALEGSGDQEASLPEQGSDQEKLMIRARIESEETSPSQDGLRRVALYITGPLGAWVLEAQVLRPSTEQIAERLATAERLNEAVMERLAEEIRERGATLVLIGGTTASGKSRFTKELKLALQEEGTVGIYTMDDQYIVGYARAPAIFHERQPLLSFWIARILVDLQVIHDRRETILKPALNLQARQLKGTAEGLPEYGLYPPATTTLPETTLAEGLYALRFQELDDPQTMRIYFYTDRVSRLVFSTLRALKEKNRYSGTSGLLDGWGKFLHYSLTEDAWIEPTLMLADRIVRNEVDQPLLHEAARLVVASGEPIEPLLEFLEGEFRASLPEADRPLLDRFILGIRRKSDPNLETMVAGLLQPPQARVVADDPITLSIPLTQVFTDMDIHDAVTAVGVHANQNRATGSAPVLVLDGGDLLSPEQQLHEIRRLADSPQILRALRSAFRQGIHIHITRWTMFDLWLELNQHDYESFFAAQGTLQHAAYGTEGTLTFGRIVQGRWSNRGLRALLVLVSLSPMERIVLRRLAEGRTIQQIADAIPMAPLILEKQYLQNVLNQYGGVSIEEAVEAYQAASLFVREQFERLRENGTVMPEVFTQALVDAATPVTIKTHRTLSHADRAAIQDLAHDWLLAIGHLDLPIQPNLRRFTFEELQVLGFMGMGMPAGEIATRLMLSGETVFAHQQAIAAKLPSAVSYYRSMFDAFRRMRYGEAEESEAERISDGEPVPIDMDALEAEWIDPPTVAVDELAQAVEFDVENARLTEQKSQLPKAAGTWLFKDIDAAMNSDKAVGMVDPVGRWLERNLPPGLSGIHDLSGGFIEGIPTAGVTLVAMVGALWALVKTGLLPQGPPAISLTQVLSNPLDPSVLVPLLLPVVIAVAIFCIGLYIGWRLHRELGVYMPGSSNPSFEPAAIRRAAWIF